jgi:hypothetical protein
MQIRSLLAQARWPTGDKALVFGGSNRVQVFAGVPTEDQVPQVTPWAMVGILDAAADEEHPDLLDQQFAVVVGADVHGDQSGQQALVGGPAPSIGRSGGRGVSELCAIVRDAAGTLSGHDGVRLVGQESASTPLRQIAPGRSLALAEISIRCLCTAMPFYTAPQRLRYQTDRWLWDGEACSRRFDFAGYRLVRKQGTSPSASPSDGTVVYSGTQPMFVGTQSSGQVYTVFAVYDSRGGGTIEGSSSPERGSFFVP